MNFKKPFTEKKTPPFVARRIQHHKFEYPTKLYFDPADDKDQAGVLIKENEWKTLCENIDARHLSTANAGGFTGTTNHRNVRNA